MDVMAATWSAEPRYLVVFKRHIVKRTRMVLARVRQVAPYLPPGLLKQALHILDYSLKLPEAWPGSRDLLLTMAPRMEQAGYRDEWMPYLQQGIYQSQRLDDIEVKAELYFQLGRIYRLRGKYEEARAEFEASIKGFEHLDAPLNQARAMNRLAQVARLQRQFEEATRLAEAALSLLGEQDTERGYSYLVLGMVAVDRRHWPESIDYFKQSLKLWEQENNQRMMGRCMISLGAAFQPMKEYQEAKEAYNKAIDLFEEAQDPVYRAIAQMNLGNVYFWLDQPDKAVKLHLQAERIFCQTHDRFYLGHVNHNIGMAYRKLRQWDNAKAAYLLGIERYQQIGNIAWMVDTMDGLGLLYLDQGHLMKAGATFEEALRRLTEIEGEPSYQKYYEIVSRHIREISEKITDQHE